MREKDWILFDFDGTLFDTSEGVTKCAAKALAEFGIDADWQEITFFVGPPLEYAFTTFYDFNEEQCARAIEIYRERYNRKGIYEVAPYPGLAECLKSLREKGYRIGVGSSKPEYLCKDILKNHGFLELFDDVCGADEATGRSMKRDVLLEAMRRAGTPDDPSKMVLIGDTAFDVEGAGELSMDCIAVSYGFGDIEAMKKAGAVAILGSMGEIDAFFKNKV